MELCRKCKHNEALPDMSANGFCRRCFAALLEARLKRSLRASVPRSGELSLAVMDELSRYALGRINLRPFKIRFVNMPDDFRPWSWKNAFRTNFQTLFSPSEFVLLPWVADDSADMLLFLLSSNPLPPLPSNFVLLWKNVSDAEASLYASLAGLSWRPSSERKALSLWLPLLKGDSSLLLGFQKSAEELSPLLFRRDERAGK